ncbi:MAG: regulatory protein RecX [Bdellovibrionales bacterium]|nr:regulatory protein RecX [Bdellovibrionales bacterium]
MRYLAQRDHSVKELREKLRRKFSVAEVNRAIESAHENGWLLPPEELATKVAESLHRKGKGRNYISRYLSLKGLPGVTWNEEVEVEKGREIIEKKIGHSPPYTMDERKKAFRLLMNRGYESAVARKVCHEEL